MKSYRKKTMKRAGVFISFLFLAGLLTGCSVKLFNGESTVFQSLQIEKEDGSIFSEGEIKLHGTDGVLLTVEVEENIEGTFQIVYSKNKGALKINQDEKEILVLEKGARKHKVFDEITVDLEKGRNDFILTGDDCTCEFAITLSVSDQSKIKSFGNGSLK